MLVAPLLCSRFPLAGTDGADCEQYGYDLNSNRTSLTKRDGSTLTYQYDALNRMTVKIVPSRAGLGAIHTRDVYYGYDVGDRQTFARFDSATGEGVANAYDTLGRLVSSTLDMDGTARTLTYTLDAGGRRTQLSWPDARETSFSYDDAGRMQAIFQGALGSTADLWTYTYSDHGRRVRKTARHGQYAEGLADGLGRLVSLHTELSGADNDNDTLFTYNPASQVASRAISNDAYAWTDHANVNRAYEVNGLNQYTEAGTATFGYDDNGNLTSDPGSASGASGVTTYLYDIENRLVNASGAANATLRYDPLGRLHQIADGTTTVRFLHDGDELVAEYSGGGTLLRRYVHGAGIDDPVVWYEGADFGDQRWLIADHQGSIVGITKAAPVLGLNSYDEYGIPAAGNQGRFQYTGQAWMPELGMYHYKARLYSPTLGRFMQTDPIGYEGGMNIYAYVGNDPVNLRDPTGNNPVALVVLGCARISVCRTAAIKTGRWIIQETVKAAGPLLSENKPDLTDDKGRGHILDGDETGGGHRAGTARPGKSEFPAEWSDEKILGEISDVATDPAADRTVQGGKNISRGTREGVDIKTVDTGERIVTGHPTNRPRNPKVQEKVKWEAGEDYIRGRRCTGTLDC